MLLDAFLYKYCDTTNKADVIIVDSNFVNMVSTICPDKYISVPLSIIALYRRFKTKPYDDLRRYYAGNEYHYNKCEDDRIPYMIKMSAKFDRHTFEESETKYKVRFSPVARDIESWADCYCYEDDDDYVSDDNVSGYQGSELLRIAVEASEQISLLKKDRKNIISIAKLNVASIRLF
jgi:hypothetical protein